MPKDLGRSRSSCELRQGSWHWRLFPRVDFSHGHDGWFPKEWCILPFWSWDWRLQWILRGPEAPLNSTRVRVPYVPEDSQYGCVPVLNLAYNLGNSSLGSARVCPNTGQDYRSLGSVQVKLWRWEAVMVRHVPLRHVKEGLVIRGSRPSSGRSQTAVSEESSPISGAKLRENCFTTGYDLPVRGRRLIARESA